MNTTTTTKTHTIEVHVSFPISPREPYHHRYEPDTTIGAVRTGAMEHFGVQEEPGSEYYLTDDHEHDRRLEDSETVGRAAGEMHELHLTLVKELIQG
jgi:hypothetical protein